MAVGAFRAAADKPAAEPDRGALVQYIGPRCRALGADLMLPVQLPGH